MSIMILSIQAAGLVHWILASANFALPRKLHYRENLARVSPIVRQIFLVHSFYIVLLLVFLGGLCVWFAPELGGPGALGKTISGFLAVFWILRVALQLSYYDRETRRLHRLGHVAFTGACAFLAAVFAAAFLEVFP